MGLRYANLDFTGIVLKEGYIGYYLGQTLRGALGLSLKRLCCHSTNAACDSCFLQSKCAYSVIFEGVPPANRSLMRKYPRIPKPFVLCVSIDSKQMFKQGEDLKFGIRLFGPAVDLYPYIIEAVRSMLERGLGRDRIPIRLEEVSGNGVRIYHHGDKQIQQFPIRQLRISTSSSATWQDIEITFITPLRLQVDGKITRKPHLNDLMLALVRRLTILTEFYGNPISHENGKRVLLDAATGAEIVQSNLQWYSLPRFSRRQKRRIPLGGIIGYCRYKWPDASINPEPWLRAASILHVGKATSFGLGRIDYKLGASL